MKDPKHHNGKRTKKVLRKAQREVNEEFIAPETAQLAEEEEVQFESEQVGKQDRQVMRRDPHRMYH